MKQNIKKFTKLSSIVVAITLIISLTGCYKKQVVEGKIILPTNQINGRVLFLFENENSFMNQTSPYSCFEDNETYYVSSLGNSNMGILHNINAEGTDTVVCKQEGCEHKSESCKGYTLAGLKLFTGDGQLYGLENSANLIIYKFDFDNLSEPVQLVKTTAVYSQSIGANVAYADNCIYITDIDKKCGILKIDLQTGDKSIFYTLPGDEYSPSIQGIFKGILIVASNNMNKAPVPTEFFAVSLETGESHLITSINSMLCVGEKAGCVYDNKLYYLDVAQNALVCYDFETGNETIIAEKLFKIEDNHEYLRTSTGKVENGILTFKYIYSIKQTNDEYKNTAQDFKIELETGKLEPLNEPAPY